MYFDLIVNTISQHVGALIKELLWSESTSSCLLPVIEITDENCITNYCLHDIAKCHCSKGNWDLYRPE